MGELPVRGLPTAAVAFVDDEAPTRRQPSTPDARAVLQATRDVAREAPVGLPRASGRVRPLVLVACAAAAGFAVVVGVVLARKPRLPVAHRDASAQAAQPVTLAAPPPVSPATQPSAVPVEPPGPPAATTAPASEVPASGAGTGAGTILTSARAKGHRIFVDGRVVGEAPTPIPIRCGPHRVKVGSKAREQTIFVPCGDVVTVN